MKFPTSISSTILGALLLTLAASIAAGPIAQDSSLSQRDLDIQTRDVSNGLSSNVARSAIISDEILTKRTYVDKLTAAGMVRSVGSSGRTDVKPNRRAKAVLTYKAAAGEMFVWWVTKENSPLAPKVLIANEYEVKTGTTPSTIHTFEYDDVTEGDSTKAAHNAMVKAGKTTGGDHTFAHGGAGWTELTTGNRLFSLAEKAVGKSATGATVKGMSTDSLHQHNLIIKF